MASNQAPPAQQQAPAPLVQTSVIQNAVRQIVHEAGGASNSKGVSSRFLGPKLREKLQLPQFSLETSLRKCLEPLADLRIDQRFRQWFVVDAAAPVLPRPPRAPRAPRQQQQQQQQFAPQQYQQQQYAPQHFQQQQHYAPQQFQQQQQQQAPRPPKQPRQPREPQVPPLPHIAEAKLVELAITLPVQTAPAGNYVPLVRSGNMLFTSGQIAKNGDTVVHTGSVDDSKLDEAVHAARLCTLNCLSHLKSYLGSLDRVQQIVKVTVFVASAAGFAKQTQVGNGASDFLVQIFGERGRHARSAVGVASLPLNSMVEVEMIVSVRRGSGGAGAAASGAASSTSAAPPTNTSAAH
eukprot:gnl/Spiro4/11897_TR6282_c0_g1_i1.p2 gnl/Spiro4/11897_TR6282_c0_g1~~gnl/Spiro4/11897_TR6282_c0_g1_i1.p2  ORF type:complete len:361 (-),score=99.89 gnl/Spiro4/11897_TR6282_c0_g1_i1:75-1124(-)